MVWRVWQRSGSVAEASEYMHIRTGISVQVTECVIVQLIRKNARICRA